MSDHVKKTIEMVQGEISQLESELTEKKRMVNSLCGLIGSPIIYTNTEPTRSAGARRSDEYYGQPLATAARSVLEKRKTANLGAASVATIFDEMVEGGFKFDAKSTDNAKRSLRTALTKNSVTFHKLPNGDYGLLEWYPNAKNSKSKDEQAPETDTDEEDGAEVMSKEFGKEEDDATETNKTAKETA